MLYISFSGASSFEKCPRNYRHQYIDKRIALPKWDALGVGQVFHAGMERLLTGQPLDLREYADKVSPEDATMIGAMLLGIPRRWEEGYTTVGVELPFELPVRKPDTGYPLRGVRYRGFVDAILEKDGRRYVLEHKTTSDVISGFGPYWARLAIDDQIALYRIAFNADGIIYNVARKPRLKPSAVDAKNAGSDDPGKVLEAFGQRIANVLASEPDEWFAWREIHKTNAEMADAAVSLFERCSNIVAAYRQGRWPRHPGACRGLYGVCPYLDVCTGRATLDDDSLFTDKVER